MIEDFVKEKVFWTRKMNLKLVKFIESRPNIWNPKHPKYTSVQIRDRTYAEFASKYGNSFTGQAVKDRWTNIRSSFANYIRKLNASRAKGEGEEYKVNWHLWEPSQFLMKVIKQGKCDTVDQNGAELECTEDNFEQNDEWSSDNDDQKDSSDMCYNIANSLAMVLKGVQNDAFGLENTKYSRVGETISKSLSQMSSYEAAKASKCIMDILFLYDKDNPDNPNNLKSNS